MATAPVWVASSAAAFGSSGTSRSLSSPSTTAIGHLLLAEVFILNATETVSATGWTKIGQEAAGGTYTWAWFWKIATEAGAKSFSFTWGTKAENAGQITAIKEFNATSPIAASAVKLNSTASKEMKFASVSPAMAHTLSCLMGGSGGTATPPAGWTERIDTLGVYLATGELAASGASGEKVVTTVESEPTATCHVAVAPVEEEGETVYTETASGTITLTGSSAEEDIATEVAAGSLTIEGSSSEVQEASEAINGSLAPSGSITESAEMAETVEGSVTISGTFSEQLEYPEVASGEISISGSVSEALEFAESLNGTIELTGTSAQLVEFLEEAAGSMLLIGTKSESYEPEEEEHKRATYVIEPVGPFHRTTEEPSPEQLSLLVRFLNLFRRKN